MVIEKIIQALIDDITDRSGLGDEWGELDDDIKEEIKQAWTTIIQKHIDIEFKNEK